MVRHRKFHRSKRELLTRIRRHKAELAQLLNDYAYWIARNPGQGIEGFEESLEKINAQFDERLAQLSAL